jgi:hypothetical protein
MLQPAASTPSFPVRIELVVGRTSFSYVGFPGGTQAVFVPNRPIQLKHIYLFKETHLSQNQMHLAHYLPLRFELVFERNTSCNQCFQGGERLILFQIGRVN